MLTSCHVALGLACSPDGTHVCSCWAARDGTQGRECVRGTRQVSDRPHWIPRACRQAPCAHKQNGASLTHQMPVFGEGTAHPGQTTQSAAEPPELQVPPGQGAHPAPPKPGAHTALCSWGGAWPPYRHVCRGMLGSGGCRPKTEQISKLLRAYVRNNVEPKTMQPGWEPSE